MSLSFDNAEPLLIRRNGGPAQSRALPCVRDRGRLRNGARLRPVTVLGPRMKPRSRCRRIGTARRGLWTLGYVRNRFGRPRRPEGPPPAAEVPDSRGPAPQGGAHHGLRSSYEEDVSRHRIPHAPATSSTGAVHERADGRGRPRRRTHGRRSPRPPVRRAAHPSAAARVQRTHLPRHLPIANDQASGSYVRDVDGNVFIDSLTGAGVLSLGHNHPELVWAAPSSSRASHPRPRLPHAGKGRLSRRATLHAASGPPGADQGALLRSHGRQRGRRGDQAVQDGDGSWGDRGLPARLESCGHGADGVGGAEAASPQRPPGVHFPAPTAAGAPWGLASEVCAVNCVGCRERSLHDNGGVPRPAAVVLELPQGEGRVIPARQEFARRVRTLTRELDIPLVVDEVQTGCGAHWRVVRIRAVRHRA